MSTETTYSRATLFRFIADALERIAADYYLKHPLALWADVTTDPRVKTYTRCRCDRRHRTIETWVRCAFSGYGHCPGNSATGPFALVTSCGHSAPYRCPRRYVSLWSTYARAAEEFASIEGKCGNRCVNDHQIIRLQPSLR